MPGLNTLSEFVLPKTEVLCMATVDLPVAPETLLT